MESDALLPSTHLLGSVPAVINEDNNKYASGTSSQANPNTFTPSDWGDGTPNDEAEQASSSLTRVFSVSSYKPYFNVDTDIVVDRVISSVNSFGGDFFRKIETTPDLYGPVWISTTLVFVLAALGNCANYLIQKRSEPNTAWNFDVSYFNWAACILYAYVLIVPAAFYFLLQYFGVSHASLIRLWCIWGYSLFIFIPSSLLLIIPVGMLQWIIILLAGSSSGSFIAMNLKTYTEGGDLMVVVVAAFLLQFALAISIKIFFFA